LVAEHIVDDMQLTDIVFILNEIDTNLLYEKAEPFKQIKSYIKRKILVGKNGIKGFLWKKNGEQLIYVKQKDTPWHSAEAEDKKDLIDIMNQTKTELLSNVNTIIGFMNDFKKENYTVFKTKNINSPRVLGARCDQNSNVSKSIELLNSIVGSDLYSTKLKMRQRQICIIQELYLRVFENERKNKKHWFLSPPYAVLTGIEKFTNVKN